MTTRVALVGASGKLGSVIDEVVSTLDGYTITHRLGSKDDLAQLREVDLIIDATTPGVSADVVARAIEYGVNVLVATSGWSSERIDELRAPAAEAGVGIFIVPNFSLGSVVGTALAAAASKFFASVEIVEAHRDTKIDSPSGTAVRTAELIAAAREEPVAAPHADQRARGQQVASVPVHSLRRPGVIARQEVLFSGPGETLSIVHDTVASKDAYAPGIRLAVPAAVSATGVVVGLDAFLDLPKSGSGENE